MRRDQRVHPVAAAMRSAKGFRRATMKAAFGSCGAIEQREADDREGVCDAGILA